MLTRGAGVPAAGFGFGRRKILSVKVSNFSWFSRPWPLGTGNCGGRVIEVFPTAFSKQTKGETKSLSIYHRPVLMAGYKQLCRPLGQRES